MSDAQANQAIRRNPDYQTAKRAKPFTLSELRDVLYEIVASNRGIGAGGIDRATIDQLARGVIVLDDLLAMIGKLTDRPVDPDSTIFPMPEMTSTRAGDPDETY